MGVGDPPVLPLEPLAQLADRLRVDLHRNVEVGSRALALDHVADQEFALLRQLDLVADQLRVALGPRSSLPLEVLADVALRDPPAGSGPLHTAQIDPVLIRNARSHRRHRYIAGQRRIVGGIQRFEVELDVTHQHSALGPGARDLGEVHASLAGQHPGSRRGSHPIRIGYEEIELRGGWGQRWRRQGNGGRAGGRRNRRGSGWGGGRGLRGTGNRRCCRLRSGGGGGR